MNQPVLLLTLPFRGKLIQLPWNDPHQNALQQRERQQKQKDLVNVRRQQKKQHAQEQEEAINKPFKSGDSLFKGGVLWPFGINSI